MENQEPIILLCQNPQHEFKPIRFFCLKEDCDLPTRLGCFDCLKYTHSAHCTHFIEYKDIFIQDENITYPDDQIAKDYKSFINHGQPQTEDLINAQIESIKIQFLQRIEQIRAELVQKVTQNQTLSVALKEIKEKAKLIFNEVVNKYYQLQQAYNLSSLRNILKQFSQNKDNVQMNNDIKSQIFNNKRKSDITFLQEKIKQFNKDLNTRYISDVYEQCSQQILTYTDLLINCIQSNEQEQIQDINKFKLEEPGSIIYINKNVNNQNQNNQNLQQVLNTNLEQQNYLFNFNQGQLKKKNKFKKQKLEQNHSSLSIIIILYQFRLSSSHWQLLQTYLIRKVKTLKLLFRATRDGLNGTSFHSKCDNKGPTITIIQSKVHERIFGGFANSSWGGQGAYVADKERKGFLFSLTNKTKHEIFLAKQQNVIYCNPQHGPKFGGGHDLYISPDFGMSSYSNLGWTYIPIVGALGSAEAKNHLAGAHNFAVKEMEVFSVDFE